MHDVFNEIIDRLIESCYSVLKAMTGSHLLAIRDGIRPEISVRMTEMTTSTIAPVSGSWAVRVGMLVTLRTMKLIGIQSSTVTSTPITPAARPMITVSAEKT